MGSRTWPFALIAVSSIACLACGEGTALVGDPDAIDTGARDVIFGDGPSGADAPDATPECTSALEGRTRCGQDGQLERCTASTWERSQCPGQSRCELNQCVPIICAQDQARCADSRTREVCSITGTRYVVETCPAYCEDGACVDHCAPGARRCDGQDVLVCGNDFVELYVETCDERSGEQCSVGSCLTECELKGAKRGYIACDFWAADLPNGLTTIDNAFAFAFSNASERPAVVKVTYPWGAEHTVEVAVGDIAQHYLPLPRDQTQLPGPIGGLYGFRIQSDQPIAAFMFNPLERYDDMATVPVTTTDATLLMPATALGTHYMAMTWSDPGLGGEPPFVTVVATEDDTELTVTTTQTINIPEPPVIAREGIATKVVLQAREVLNLETAHEPGIRRDLTGTRVESTKPVAVFSGNRCARVPDSGGGCDHLETQLPPIETWGDHYIVSKLTDRGGEPDYFRVLALEDFTELTIDPPRFTPVLVAGGFWEFASTEGFELHSTKPVMVGQFMASSSETTAPGAFDVTRTCRHDDRQTTCLGDSALVLAAPYAQWRPDLPFLVPDTYRFQFINVIFAAGTTFTVDGASVDTGAAAVLGSGEWRSVTLPMLGGYHKVLANVPVSVIVYGYDHNIGYAYNAGLDFEQLRAAP